jgi:diguanylate cyclase (GGDEF)-like protein/PAS domain S-box-containing protein
VPVLRALRAHPTVLRRSAPKSAAAAARWFCLVALLALAGPWFGPLKSSLGGVLAATLLVLLAGVGMRHERRRRADARLCALTDASLDLITVVDAGGGVLYQSPAFSRLLGFESQAEIGTPIGHLVDARDAPRLLQSVRLAEQGKPGVAVESRWRHVDGSVRWMETVCNNLLADPRVGGIVLTSRDVTDRRTEREELHRRAFQDPLTGLANRARLAERLSAAVARTDTELAVLFIDLDNFKTVNDGLGHAAGDRFLSEIADRLRACVRTGDLVARMGGDEFAVLLQGVGAGIRASRVADRILAKLDAPINLDGRAVTPGASIGITSGASAESAQQILRNADLALYAAKHTGKGHVQVYRPAMHTAAVEQLELQTGLRSALEREEFVLHYQPLFALDDGGLRGYEALVRWQHPTRGLLLPDSFIGLAEQTGLIVPLTRWALTTACCKAAAWQRALGEPLRVAVNLSLMNLNDETVLTDVRSALDAAGIEAGQLALEITESTVTRDCATSLTILYELRKLGVQLALDDFGTGHSSLSRLAELPFHSLKIPRPFIVNMARRQADFALTHGIVELGRRLGLQVVAEGIETEQQLARVHALGCELAQGFYLAPPAPAETTDPERDTASGRAFARAESSARSNAPALTLIKTSDDAKAHVPVGSAPDALRLRHDSSSAVS